MITKHEIIKMTQGHPTICKMFLRFLDNGDNLDEQSIKDVFYTLLKHKKEVAGYGVNFSQIKDINFLIAFLNQSLDLSLKKKHVIKDYKDNLKKNNIKYCMEKNVIEFEIKTFEQMKEFGSEKWCIAKSLKYFNEYKAGEKKFIIRIEFRNNKIFKKEGITINKNNELYCVFDNDNNEIRNYNEYSYLLSKNLSKLTKQNELSIDFFILAVHFFSYCGSVIHCFKKSNQIFDTNSLILIALIVVSIYIINFIYSLKTAIWVFDMLEKSNNIIKILIGTIFLVMGNVISYGILSFFVI